MFIIHVHVHVSFVPWSEILRGHGWKKNTWYKWDISPEVQFRLPNTAKMTYVRIYTNIFILCWKTSCITQRNRSKKCTYPNSLAFKFSLLNKSKDIEYPNTNLFLIEPTFKYIMSFFKDKTYFVSLVDCMWKKPSIVVVLTWLQQMLINTKKIKFYYKIQIFYIFITMTFFQL